MNLSTLHVLATYLYTYIHISVLSVCLSVQRLCVSPPGHILQTKNTPWKLLLVVALHQIKCGVMFWERLNCTKKQEEQGYCDVSKYHSISLTIWIYIYVSLFLSVSLSKNYVFVLQATSSRLRRPPWNMLLLAAPHQNKFGVMSWKVKLCEEARGTGKLWCI
jgi:hypothetical protein